MKLRFDESLPRLIEEVGKLFGPELLRRSAFIREAAGRLSVVVPVTLKQKKLADAERVLRKALGAYSRPEKVITDMESPGAARILEEARQVHPILVAGTAVRLLDRRVVGADWLKPPAATRAEKTTIPRIAFFSLKGGVGRSTALCVMAAHLSRRGRRVLAIDFDLEAPGIGTMLLHDEELPRFGTLDYLVENGLSGIDQSFMADLGGDSALGSQGARVTVVPAIGRATLDNPTDVLSKIARAYIEDIRPDGRIISLSEQLREMVERFEATKAYDAILVDVRAGLHETSAAALLALGGEALLFGLDQPQTYLGYRLLMAHLSRFSVEPSDDWRERLRFVHGKAPDSPKKQQEAEARFLSLYSELELTPSIDKGEMEELSAKDFDVEWQDNLEEDLELELFEPPPIVHILDDSRYREFDPISDDTLLSSRTYLPTFGELLQYSDMIVGAGESWDDNGK